MKVLTFHSIALTRHFQSTLFSQASLFYCVSLALTFVSPLLIAYSSHGFWIKHQIHRETPEVRFKNQALIIVHSDSTPFPFTWSTFNRYNALMDQYLRLPTVTSLEKDVNNDGLADQLDFEMKFEIMANETIRYVELYLVFSYKLHEVTLVSMESMARFQYQSPLTMEKVHFSGDLEWFQRRVLNFGQSDDRYDVPVLGGDDQFELIDAVRLYNNRPYSAQVISHQCNPVFSIGSFLVVNVSLNYAEATIYYAPGFWNTLKWAWVQYVAFLVIFMWLLRILNDWVFFHGIVPSWNPDRLSTIATDNKSL